MGNTPATCRPYLESMVGQPCDITRAQLAAYLVRYGIQVTEIGGELNQPVSRAEQHGGARDERALLRDS